MEKYVVAWWNLENLFDEEHAPVPERRTAKVERVIKGELTGWTPELRDTKIGRLATVIAGMNSGAGPDLLGVCEIENRYVLDLLVQAINAELTVPRNYGVIHADTSDARGIDVAFIYDTARMEVPDPEKDVFFHVVMRRTATRDIVQVTFRTTTTSEPRTFVVFGNHWPSRSGGEPETSPYRAVAGETLGYWHQRVLEVLGEETPVMAMGDFNDEAFNASLVQHALSCRDRRAVATGRIPKLWNLTWPLLGAAAGTFYFDSEPNMLDQFLINKNLLIDASPIKADPSSVCIIRPIHAGTNTESTKPVPFGLGQKANPEGFSDHFPIAMTLIAT